MANDVTDEDNIIGIRLAYDMSELPVKGITNAIDVSSIQNPIPVQNNYGFTTINKDQSDVVNAGANEIISFTPPAGSIYLVKGIYFTALQDSDATSGTMKMTCYISSNYLGVEVKSDYNAKVGFQNGHLFGNVYKRPASDLAAINLLYNFYATENTPLSILFSNDTDISHTAPRSYRLLAQEVPAT